MRPLSAPFQAFEFDLNNVAKPKELGRAERLAALAQCEAAAHPEFDRDGAPARLVACTMPAQRTHRTNRPSLTAVFC